MPMESVMPYNHLILCRALLLLPSILPSIRVFSNKSAFHTSGQSIGYSASALVLPMTIQGWFPLGLTGLISLQSKGLSRVFSITVRRHQFFSIQHFLLSSSHNAWGARSLVEVVLYGQHSFYIDISLLEYFVGLLMKIMGKNFFFLNSITRGKMVYVRKKVTEEVWISLRDGLIQYYWWCYYFHFLWFWPKF